MAASGATDLTPTNVDVGAIEARDFLDLVPAEWPTWRSSFLRALREGGVIKFAAEDAGVTRQHAHYVRQREPLFAELWQAALEDGLDVIEQVARNRAIEGSDKLVIFLLKSHRPGTYGDKATIDLNLSLPETLAGALSELEAEEAGYRVIEPVPDAVSDEPEPEAP